MLADTQDTTNRSDRLISEVHVRHLVAMPALQGSRADYAPDVDLWLCQDPRELPY